jgi:hypothetical protein
VLLHVGEEARVHRAPHALTNARHKWPNRAFNEGDAR